MINDQMQYLQINLPEQQPLFGVVMAGNTDFDNYVTLFKVNNFALKENLVTILTSISHCRFYTAMMVRPITIWWMKRTNLKCLMAP